MIWYHGLHQLHIFKVETQLDSKNDQKFVICFYFTDGVRFVCHTTVKPLIKDRRTGGWTPVITLGISTECELTLPFKQILRRYVKELTLEILSILTGEY